jgi:type IV pilus assembly protein PilB
MDILVVDDHQATALAICGTLEDFGHTVTIVYNAHDALKRLDAGHFSVVITDWVMPGMDGLDLCREIRKSGREYVYTVLVTVKSSADDRLAALAAGADDFLIKPVDSGDLVTRLQMAERILAMKQELRDGSTRIKRLSGAMEQQSTLLGNILLSEGGLTANQLVDALDVQAATGRSLYDVLRENGMVSSEQLARARGVQIDMPYVDVRKENPDPFVLAMVSPEVALRCQVLPLSIRNDALADATRLTIAMADPWNIETIDEIQRNAHCRVETVLASDAGLKAAIDRAYRPTLPDITMGVVEVTAAGPTELVDFTEVVRLDDEASIVRFVDSLLTDAIGQRASAIHLEPHRVDFDILHRIDGRLRAIRTAPRQFLDAAISRIKTMAKIDIPERRFPQEGRGVLEFEDRRIDLRVSTLPTQFGERLVIRLLETNDASLMLDRLGFSAANILAFEELIHRQSGLILVTGPEDSGRSTTLYAALNEIRKRSEGDSRDKKNIITCEDPMEGEIAGVSQSNIHESAGLTFARQLRAILRQEPDVVLVGEIRDAETAEIALRAASTGQLVLSTLHCNDAAGAVSRLLDMGTASFVIASGLSGIVSQRLVRRLCPHCRRPASLDQTQRSLWQATLGSARPDFVIYEAAGCQECDHVGYHGRLAIHEILVNDDRICRLIMDRAEIDVVRQQAIERGMIPMELDGLDKVKQGVTTVGEVRWG